MFGEVYGYVLIIYGWLFGEVICWVDGCELGEVIVVCIVVLLGLDFYIGLDDSQFGCVVYMVWSKGSFGDVVVQCMLKIMMSELLVLIICVFINLLLIFISINKLEW